MNETKKTTKAPKPQTPRQAEIKKLIDVGRAKRTEQQDARLDQLKKEEARDRFLKLAPKRVQNVLEALRRLGQCGNRASYDYNESEAQKIAQAVMAATEEAIAAFNKRKEEKARFAL